MFDWLKAARRAEQLWSTVRRAKIVATLGPATDGLELELVRAGLDVARLNFSHGTAAEHARRCAAVREAAAHIGRPVAVMQDLQGPKIRVGTLERAGRCSLTRARSWSSRPTTSWAPPSGSGCTYQHLAHDVQPGDRILLDDGRIRLKVLAASDGEVTARVEEGGPLGEHKGINLPGVAVSSPAITDKDRVDLAFGLQELGVDYVALSFVRTAEEVRAAQELMRSLGRTAPLVVKLEKGEAIDNLEAILQVADAVMVARGDLGVELAPEQVPMLQKRIIQRANHRGIPVITATQMLESMITEETPDARRGERRGQRGLGRQRRGHALGRDGHRAPPAAGAEHDGSHRARGRIGRGGAAARRPRARRSAARLRGRGDPRGARAGRGPATRRRSSA